MEPPPTSCGRRDDARDSSSPPRCRRLRLGHGLDDVGVTGVGDGHAGDAVVATAGGAEVDVVCEGGGGWTREVSEGNGVEAPSRLGPNPKNPRVTGRRRRARGDAATPSRTPSTPPGTRGTPRAMVRGRMGGCTHCQSSGERQSWQASRSTRSPTCAGEGSCWR